MKAILVVAHGSRRTESNEEVRRLARRLEETMGPAFDMVSYAFLEISDPLLDATIADLAEKGVTEIRVFPYFLAAGTHVVNDIPRIIKEEQAKYPELYFDILPHLGALPGISTLILNQIYKGCVPVCELEATGTD